MAFKPITRRIILWSIAVVVFIIAVGIIVVPPMITLNGLKPQLQHAITAQTGVDAQINGNVHFSLLGGATIVANNISIPDGNIGSVAFRVPLSSIFNLSTAQISSRISIYDANVEISRLIPVPVQYGIDLRNVTVRFKDKDYTIVTGRLNDGEFQATVRTDQHKYDVNWAGDEFYITNKNNALIIRGVLSPDGGARGTMSIITSNVNKMFEFPEPKIDMSIEMTMQFDWDGEYGFKFTNIRGNGFNGNIELSPDGHKDIQLSAPDIAFDLSFLTRPTEILRNTVFDLNLGGDLTIGDRHFSRLIIQATGTDNALKIKRIVADDTIITGGTITPDGATDVTLSTMIDGRRATCLFSGTPNTWTCKEFTYGKMTGKISVTDGVFNVSVKSDTPMPSNDVLEHLISKLGNRGVIKFIFPDASGTLHVEKGRIRPEYKYARDKTLAWLGINMDFLPEFMQNEIGDVSLDGSRVTFRPHSKRWELVIDGRAFVLSGISIHDWTPSIDMQAINDYEYLISGLRAENAISDLTIKIADHTFKGSMTGDTITLKTDLLNIDTFIAQDFIDNYQELEFLTDAPIMLPFGLNVNVSLRADTLMYNGNEFKNFVYSLKPNNQTFSITDNARGNILATIAKEKKEYDIFIQLNKFVTNGILLADTMPLNIKDGVITGEIDMHTYGQIAHDIAYNMTGDIDLKIDNGYITGIGIDEFYASADNLTTFNAEFAIARALESGQSQLKQMHIMGHYHNGNFETTQPWTFSVRHADASGVLEITDNQMRATMDITLRGAAPVPLNITLGVRPDGGRNYSLSEIMNTFDAGFMRQFIKTHNKF